MKKVTTFLLLCLAFMLAFSTGAYADEHEELVDLYPYGSIACLEAADACRDTKVGNSNWTSTYYGHRYFFVRGAVRYTSEFEDTNADGFISALEMGSVSWPSFGHMLINDTDEDVILITANARTDIGGGVVDRIYAYFNDEGALVMFEDQINGYWIFNDGTVEAPDWRLATEAEIAAYEAAPEEEKPVTTRNAQIRMILDEEDADGYVLEPLTWITWRNADIDASEPKTAWSTLLDYDPEEVHIPAGWTVIAFGTLDRGTANPLTTAYIKTFPDAMLDETVAPLEIEYHHQPATFSGLMALDDDLVTPGINVVVEYNGEFDLSNTIEASWLNMFDENGIIINQTEMLDYEVVISQDGVDLETITFTYDSETEAYTPSGPVTVIDSSEFGSGYIASYIVETPVGDETVVEVDIVIGVMPPRFEGVADRFVNEGVIVDLLHNITANDGYANDKTDDIIVTYPAGFNPYYALPGVYEIELEFTHNVFFAGQDSIVTVKDEQVPFDQELYYNAVINVNADAGVIKVWDDVTNFKTAGSAWGSVMTVVAADGTLKERYDRYNWEHTTSEGTVVGDADAFAAWQAALTLQPGEFVVAAHGSIHATRLRAANLAFGDPISVQVGVPDFSYDILTQTSYTLTVDDTTPPVLLVINENMRVRVGDYTNINQLILSNVVAFDNYDDREDVAIYVSNTGSINLNTPGTYTVEVTAEDIAGNSTVASFTIQLVAPAVTPGSVQDLIDASTLTAAEIQALIDGSTLTEEEIAALILSSQITQTQIQDMIDAAVEAAINDLRDELTPDEVDEARGCLGGTNTKVVNYSAAILPLISIIVVFGIAVIKRFH